jgi:hypothetical protein
VKKIFFDLKSWEPLKNFKIRSGSYSGLVLSIYVKKNKIKISLDCPFKIPYVSTRWWYLGYILVGTGQRGIVSAVLAVDSCRSFFNTYLRDGWTNSCRAGKYPKICPSYLLLVIMAWLVMWHFWMAASAVLRYALTTFASNQGVVALGSCYSFPKISSVLCTYHPATERNLW